MDNLTFDKDKHIYYLDSKKISNVTSVLDSINLIDLSCVNKKVLAKGQYRGTAVHETVRLYNKKTLDIDTLSDTWKKYLAAYITFIEDVQADILEYELKVYSKKYLCAGTLDLLLAIKNILHIVDIKTGVINDKYCRLQTSAYENFYREMTGERKVIKRYSLKLNEDGTYKLSQEYNDKNDYRYFLSALQVHNFKMAK